jgi:hypothetical protein
MKLRVFTRVFGVAIIIVILLFLSKVFYTNTPLHRDIDIAICLIFTLSALLSDSRYIEELNISDDKVFINYITHFLKSRAVSLQFSDIQQVKLTRNRWPGIWPSFLIVRMKDKVLMYRVITARIYKQLEHQIAGVHFFEN